MSHFAYRRTPETIFTSVDEDILALNVQGGRCYGMEDVTASVWQMLAEPMEVSAICHHLRKVYDIDPDTCHEDVERLIAQLEGEGLVEKVYAGN